MYMKDLNHKMTLRLNDDLQEFVTKMANEYQLTPSDYIRQCIAIQKRAIENTSKIIGALTNDMTKELKGVLENGIDRKTDINN